MTNTEIIYYYWILIATNIGLAIIPHLLVRPIWFFREDGSHNVTVIEMVYTALILPVLLIIFNYHFNSMYQIHHFYINAILILLSILISNYFHFRNWGDSTGLRHKPDSGTIMLGRLVLRTGWIVSLIGIFIVFLMNK